MWIDYRTDIRPLFEGGSGTVGQSYWMVLRMMRIGEYSSHWNTDTHEAVGGPKWNYDDHFVRVISSPNNVRGNDGNEKVITAGSDDQDARLFAIQFSDVFAAGNHRVPCGDDILYDIDKPEGNVAPTPPIHATGRYTILNAEPVRGDNGRIEIVYITAKRQSGVA